MSDWVRFEPKPEENICDLLAQASTSFPTHGAVLQRLASLGRIDNRLLAAFWRAPKEEVRADWPKWVPHSLIDAYRGRGIARPWLHQVQAAEAIWRGQTTVVATGTGSGKSLSVWLPHLSAVLAADQKTSSRISQFHARPCAIYMTPTKALAADQVAGLNELISTPSDRLPIRVGPADGDTEADVKSWVREHADVIATNPDYVHHVLLPSAQRWRRVLRSLNLIVVDELHSYRGIMGAHVAWTVRRLLRLARRFGANPTVVFLSATMADPAQAAAHFLGIAPEKVNAICEDTTPAGRKAFLVWRPKQVHTDTDEADEEEGVDLDALPRRSTVVEAGELTAELAQAGQQTLTFVRSRGAAETVAAVASDYLSTRDPALMRAIAAYRGGYLPEERRALEAALRKRQMRALATTSALELGIDVSGLDATITTGWPGTRASLQQQLGRAGRAGADGIGILIAAENPLDQYFCDNPQQIFAGVEESIFPTLNPYVVGPHLSCAAAEAPLTAPDLDQLGVSQQLVDQLTAIELLHKREDSWVWNVTRPERPWDLVDIRGGGKPLQLIDADTGSVVGDVDEARADSVAHPGAIYVHQGRVYRVLGREEDVALVEPGPAKLRTRPWEQHRVRILNETRQVADPNGLVDFFVGDVEVGSQIISYDLLRLPGLQFISENPLSLPERILPTQAVWWQLSAAGMAELALPPEVLGGALHGAEHASIGILPLLANCDRWDLGGLSTVSHEQSGKPTVFVYDAQRGGAGFASYAYSMASNWLQATLERVSGCECESGCPRCIVSPKCGNNNDPLHKQGAISVLILLVSALARIGGAGTR